MLLKLIDLCFTISAIQSLKDSFLILNNPIRSFTFRTKIDKPRSRNRDSGIGGVEETRKRSGDSLGAGSSGLGGLGDSDVETPVSGSGLVRRRLNLRYFRIVFFFKRNRFFNTFISVNP